MDWHDRVPVPVLVWLCPECYMGERETFISFLIYLYFGFLFLQLSPYLNPCNALRPSHQSVSWECSALSKRDSVEPNFLPLFIFMKLLGFMNLWKFMKLEGEDERSLSRDVRIKGLQVEENFVRQYLGKCKEFLGNKKPCNLSGT